MAEVVFARQFLASFEARPQKLPNDYKSDYRKLPAQPAFILPRMSKPFPTSSEKTESDHAFGTTTAATAAISVTLAPFRQTPGSPDPVTLKVTPKTSIYDIKIQLGARTGYTSDRLKVLWERKPVNDSKTVSEATGSTSGKLDMGVMYVGSPTNQPQPEGSGPPSEDAQAASDAKAEQMVIDKPAVAEGQGGHAVLETSEFWEDLQGYLTQRLRDEGAAKEATALWRRSWQSR